MKVYFVGSPEEVKGIKEFYRISQEVDAEFYWFCFKVDKEVVSRFESVKFVTGLSGLSLTNEIKKMDIFLSFSSYEGFSLPISEALLNQKPVIAYQTDELKCVYDNYINFVSVGDYDKIKLELENCISKYDKYKKKSLEGQKYILDNFSPEVVVKKFLNQINNGI